MKRPSGGHEKIDLALLPASLRRRIEGALALAQLDPAQVPEESRTAVFGLRKRVQAGRPETEGLGCLIGLLGFMALKA